MTIATQGKHLIEVIYLQFQHHGREHSRVQSDMVLQKYLSIQHSIGNKKSTETLGGVLSMGNLKVHPHSDPFLQQCHTYFNKTAPPKSVTPYEIFGGQLPLNYHNHDYRRLIPDVDDWPKIFKAKPGLPTQHC